MPATYKVIRFFQDPNVKNRTVSRGLALLHAQEICSDPEGSSETCKKPHNRARTRELGPWFLGYTQE